MVGSKAGAMGVHWAGRWGDSWVAWMAVWRETTTAGYWAAWRADASVAH